MTKAREKTTLEKRSLRIKRLSIIFPVFGACLIALAFFKPWRDNSEILAEFVEGEKAFDALEASVDAPTVSFTTENGDQYTIAAKNLIKDPVGGGFQAEEVVGTFSSDDGNWRLRADRGSSDAENEHFEFFGKVVAEISASYTVKSEYVFANPDANEYSSNQRSNITGNGLDVFADQFQYQQNESGNVLHLQGNVVGQIEVTE